MDDDSSGDRGDGPDGAGRPLPSAGHMLARGLTRRCARCGSGRLFTSWFRMVERCPHCRYRFEREEGFFLGALVINFGVTAGVLALLLGVMIAMLANGGDSASVAPVVALAVFGAVAVPVGFYPFSKTTWAAVDLALRRGEFPSAGQTGGITRD